MVVLMQEALVLAVEIIERSRFFHAPEEELLLVGTEGALDDRVLVRIRLVNVVVSPALRLRHEVMEALLEFQSVVRLYEVRGERERYALQRLDRKILYELWPDDACLVPAERSEEHTSELQSQ